MQAIILSAGLGLRLRPLTNNLPKVMLPIKGKPLLEYHIEQLKKYGVKEIFINLHYLPERITDYFKDGQTFGVKINYHFEKELLGTAGAITAFSSKLKKHFFLLFGDLFTNFNYSKLMDFHREQKGIGTMVIHKTDHPEDSDLVILNGKRIKHIYLKPHNFLPNQEFFGIAGIYIFSKEILEFIKLGEYSDLAQEILPIILKKELPLYGYIASDYIRDIGTLQRYNKLIKAF